MAATIIDAQGQHDIHELTALSAVMPLAAIYNKSVILASKHTGWLAKTVAVLANHAAHIIVLPRDANVEILPELLPKPAADYLLTDNSQPWCESLREYIRDDILELLTYPVAIAAAAACEPISTRWTLFSSGTTGVPKPIVHDLNILTNGVARSERYTHYRWGMLYDLARYAGTQVFVQALHNAEALIVPDAHAPLNQRVHFLATQGCNALSATPSLWRQILMCEDAAKLPFTQITLGGEIADQAILDRLARAYPEAQITHIYASTEAGVVFAVHDKQAGFPAHFLTDGYGTHQLRYTANDTLEVNTTTSGTWLNTGDVIRCEGERYYFAGRLGAGINIGGTEVFPERIEAQLRTIAGVQDVAIVAKKNSILGHILEAHIVPEVHIDAAELRQTIITQIKNDLRRAERPARIKLVDQLALSSAGKIVRI